MKETILALAKLGKIPNEDDLSDELFRQYDSLIQTDEPLTYEEAEVLMPLFSDDCYDLNDGLMRVIETVPIDMQNPAQYRALIAKCGNAEFREMMENRLNNTLKNAP